MKLGLFGLLVLSSSAFAEYDCTTTCHATVQPVLFREHSPRDGQAFRDSCLAMGGHFSLEPGVWYYCTGEYYPSVATESASGSTDYEAREQSRWDCRAALPSDQTNRGEYLFIGPPAIDGTTCEPRR